MARIIPLALALLSFSAPAAAITHIDGVAIAESALRDELRDPASAQFTWPYDFQYGTFRMGSKSAEGWLTCGTVNGKNGFGGYAGRTATLVVLRDDKAIVALIDRPTFPLLAKTCEKMGMPVVER